MPQRCRRGRYTTHHFPRFLDLSPELRNCIYRCALVSPGTILLEGEARREPALLRAARQLRDEGASIYYSENTFVVDIHNMAGVEMMPFRHLLRRYRKSVQDNFTCQLHPGVDWANLLQWLKSYHDPQSPVGRSGLTRRNEQNPDAVIMARAFDVVARMKSDRWSKVEAVLEAFHLAVAASRPVWT